jgi:hypothetical protein
VLARGVADRHAWSIGVAEYVVEHGHLAEGHKPTLRKRRDAYERRDATSAPSSLQAPPTHWRPRGTRPKPEAGPPEEDLDEGDEEP